MGSESSIADVADTALWVAALRARETQRADAMLHDPLASMLAGSRGDTIARSFPQSAVVGWSVVIRTCALDRLIRDAVTQGVDTVVNLGAGMDTRPYRLNLPKHLRWIEIDFPHLVQSKNEALGGHEPSCTLERVGLNLLDRAARNALFAAIGARSEKTLLIAEGVMPYFSNQEAALLASDLRANASFQSWILDFDNAGLRNLPRSWAKRLRAAPFLFQVPDWFKFFEQYGWHPRTVITSAEESARLGRPYPYTFPTGLLMHVLPREVSRRILSVSGAVLLNRGK